MVPAEWIGDAETGALALLTRQPARFLHSQLGQTSLAEPRPPSVCVHPSEAVRRRIADGDPIIIALPRGRCRARMEVSDLCRPGIAVMETGPWFEGGPANLDCGDNPNAVTSDIATSALSQATAAQTCLVTIERFAG